MYLPLYMRFIDLQREFDSVDKELLWVVPERSGVPTKMLTIILNFHEACRLTYR